MVKIPSRRLKPYRFLEGRMADKPTDAATFVSRGLSGLRGADMRQIVKVLRDGAFHTIPLEDVVVGDVVMLEMGDEIPADGRLLRRIAAASGRVQPNATWALA
jgi:cation transport ATPase